jgi:hypothetical protein
LRSFFGGGDRAGTGQDEVGLPAGFCEIQRQLEAQELVESWRTAQNWRRGWERHGTLLYEGHSLDQFAVPSADWGREKPSSRLNLAEDHRPDC